MKIKIDTFTGRVSCNDIVLNIWARKVPTRYRGVRWNARTKGVNMFSLNMRKPEMKKALAEWISKNPYVFEEAVYQ